MSGISFMCHCGYGVVYVDADNLGNGTYKRYKKKSFKFYKEFIAKERESVKS